MLDKQAVGTYAIGEGIITLDNREIEEIIHHLTNLQLNMQLST